MDMHRPLSWPWLVTLTLTFDLGKVRQPQQCPKVPPYQVSLLYGQSSQMVTFCTFWMGHVTSIFRILQNPLFMCCICPQGTYISNFKHFDAKLRSQWPKRWKTCFLTLWPWPWSYDLEYRTHLSYGHRYPTCEVGSLWHQRFKSYCTNKQKKQTRNMSWWTCTAC